MALIRGSRGQSTAEYAVLFAIVIGAAVAMQQYIKGRLQWTTKQYADGYVKAAGGVDPSKSHFDPLRNTKSSSGTDLGFTDSKRGMVVSTSGSVSGINKSKDDN